MGTKEYGVRFIVINKKGELVNKEKWFESREKMENYLNKLDDKGELYRVDAYSSD